MKWQQLRRYFEPSLEAMKVLANKFMPCSSHMLIIDIKKPLSIENWNLLLKIFAIVITKKIGHSCTFFNFRMAKKVNDQSKFKFLVNYVSLIGELMKEIGVRQELDFFSIQTLFEMKNPPECWEGKIKLLKKIRLSLCAWNETESCLWSADNCQTENSKRLFRSEKNYIVFFLWRNGRKRTE